jgi:uncharacterized protein (TIGR02099 family)
MIHHITRATRHLIFWSLIAFAIGLTSVRLLLAEVASYKSEISQQLGELIGAPVKVGRIRAKMRGFSPELVLSEIAIISLTPQTKPAIQLKEVRLGLNLLDTLIRRNLLSSSWITLVGAKLTVKRKADGSLAIVGLKSSDEQPLWLLQGRKYEVLQSEVLWQDEKTPGRPFKLTAVDIAILNDDQRHRVNLLMQLPDKWGQEIRVSMELKGNVFEPSVLAGRVYLEGRRLKLAALNEARLPVDLSIHGGEADIKLWSHWQQARLISLTGEGIVSALNLARPAKPPLTADKLETRFNWQSTAPGAATDQAWQLNVEHLLLTPENKPKNVDQGFLGGFTIQAPLLKAGWQPKIGVWVKHLELALASDLAQFFSPLPDAELSPVKQAKLTGQLEDMALFVDWTEKKFAVNGKFFHLGFDPVLSMPGLQNLSGHLRGTEDGGIVRLMTENARFSSAELFREPLALSQLIGAINWRQTEQHWLLSSRRIELNSPDIQTVSKFNIALPKNSDPVFLDIQGSFAGNDASKAWHYLPVGVLQPSVVDWLDHAFIAGRVPEGQFLFYGKPREFPFAHGEGVFETQFAVEQMELAYHPDWPHLTEVNADVLFFQDSLKVDLHEGLSSDVQIKQAAISIPVLGESEHLLVQGGLEGSFTGALNYLQQTPLKPQVEPVIQTIDPVGETKVKLNLKIPLLDNALAKVDGEAQLNNAKLTVKALNIPVTQVQGLLNFNEKGLYSDVIQAKALAHPIKIRIANTEQGTAIAVDGHAEISELQQLFPMPGWDQAGGDLDYQLRLMLPFAQSQSPTLTVQSPLIGVIFDLPGILNKRKEQSAPLSLVFRLVEGNQLLPLTLNYDNQVKAVLTLDTQRQSIYSGHVLLGEGEGEAQPRPRAGLSIEVNRDRLPLHDWLNLAVQSKDAKAVSTIQAIKLHSAHALWHKTELGTFDLSLQQQGDQWLGSIGSRFASGQLTFPSQAKANDKIVLAMDMLDISALKQLKAAAEPEVSAGISPKSLPLFTLSSHKTFWKTIDLGFLSIDTEPLPAGLAFKPVKLTRLEQNLELTASWIADSQQSLTQVSGRLAMPNAGELFTRLGVSKDLAETEADIHFDINWNAAPYQVSLPKLKGQVEVALKNGRLLSIEPGFGRVLGVLAMAQWLKRLQLDFSDIYQEGLTFNTIKGRFDLAQGKAATHNLVVDAIPAKITISGNTDLVNRTVDHIVNVTPKSADALPIAGTIMGKVAKLVARSLTGEDHEGFLFGSQYLVKGQWGNAEIISLHENDGLLQKTWNGITAFPWLEQQKK